MKGAIYGFIVIVLSGASFSLGWYLNNSSHFDHAKDLYVSRINALEAQSLENNKKRQALLDQLHQKNNEILELKTQAFQDSTSNESITFRLSGNRPLAVRTFFDGKLIGHSELVFAGSRPVKNGDGTFKVVKEPVVRLPIKYKSLFTQTLTNFVQRPTLKNQTTYNSNYYNDNRGFYPSTWGYGPSFNANPAIPPSAPRGNKGYYNGNPHIRNDEISKPRVR